ncbi:MAG: flagellar hook capping protein [Lachnospiraceae bacterium]|jgi:flagellar basal-body rod modification protein FlgD|nr:flagellar hook capping protein [Lachnospiraceae bacterium]
MADLVSGLGATVKDGKMVDKASASSTSEAKSASGNGAMDKDAFLQLLVAQMKYQDPLEPASNTEYISQYATFSELEQMQNMSASLELSRASSLVGKTVTIRTQLENGDIQEVEGNVDFVVYENNKAMLSIDGELYSANDVYATVDDAYKTAYELAEAFNKAMAELPKLDDVTLTSAEVITNLKDGYNSMTAYQQKYIDSELVDQLQKYVNKIDEMSAEALAGSFAKELNGLPAVDQITLKDEEVISNLDKLYNESMSDYQRGFIDEKDVERLEAYVEQLNKLKEAAGETDEEDSSES